MTKAFCLVALASLLAVALASPAGAQQATILTREIVTVQVRPGVRLRYLGLVDSQKPVAAIVLMAGGKGVLSLGPTGTIDTDLRLNFLIRSRELFASQGFYVAALDAASDLEEGMNGAYRLSLQHARELGHMIAHLKGTLRVPVWLAGTSSSTLSIVSAAARLPAAGLPRPDGIVLTSSMTELTPLCVKTVYDASLSAIRGPVLIVSHRDDGCECTPGTPAAGSNLLAALTGASAKTLKIFTGGLPPVSGPCAAHAPHGFFGIEDRVVESIADWIKTH